MRCKACGNDWRANAEDAPLELGEGVAAAASPSFNQIAPVVEEIAPEDLTPPALTQTFRARAVQKRRTQKAIQQGLSWGLLAVLVLSGFIAAYFWRDNIVARVPKLASVYKMVGIETNPVGLDFEVINTGFANNDISQIYVSGALRNLRDHEIVVPPIRIALLDRSGREYDHHILRLQEPPVLPGAVQGFAVVLPNTEGRFAETRVELIWQQERAKPAAPEKSAPAKAAPAKTETRAEPTPAQTAPEPAPIEATPIAPAAKAPAAAPAAKAPAQAAAPAPTKVATPQATPASNTPNDGLRRISQLTTSSPTERTDLDTGRLEGVSARHG